MTGTWDINLPVRAVTQDLDAHPTYIGCVPRKTDLSDSV